MRDVKFKVAPYSPPSQIIEALLTELGLTFNNLHVASPNEDGVDITITNVHWFKRGITGSAFTPLYGKCAECEAACEESIDGTPVLCEECTETAGNRLRAGILTSNQ